MNDKLYDIERIITHGYGKTARELAVDIARLYTTKEESTDFEELDTFEIFLDGQKDRNLVGYDFSRNQISIIFDFRDCFSFTGFLVDEESVKAAKQELFDFCEKNYESFSRRYLHLSQNKQTVILCIVEL